MAKLPGVKLIDRGTLPDEPWAEQLADSLNQFMRGVNNVLANGITVIDNMSGQVNDHQIFVSNRSNPYPFAFSWQFPEISPQGCIIVRADTPEGTEGIFSALQPKWSYSAGRIVIEAIRGDLELGRWYDLRFYTFG